MKYSFIFALALVVTVCSETGCKNQAVNALNPYSYQIQKNVTSANGAVVSAHPLASKVGIMILQQGGNAVDASIATQLALAVVYPGAGNLGGGGFMVARVKDGKTITLDYREKAPWRPAATCISILPVIPLCVLVSMVIYPQAYPALWRVYLLQ